MVKITPQFHLGFRLYPLDHVPAEALTVCQGVIQAAQTCGLFMGGPAASALLKKGTWHL